LADLVIASTAAKALDLTIPPSRRMAGALSLLSEDRS
jgi:hypothetical protein